MEDCTITTETINGVHYTYYSRDGVVVAERHRLRGFGRDVECWYRDGKLHRVDGPAKIEYEDGQIYYEMWYRDGKWHRDNGPAVIDYRDGQKTGEYWFYGGKRHRIDEPTAIFYKNGQKTGELWYRDNELHRDDGPAAMWCKNGQITEERWYRNGELSAINTLALIIYQNIGLINKYHIGCKRMSSIDEFRDKVKGDAIHDALRPLPIPIRQAIIPHYCYQ